jgi:hypothetical protein
MLGVLAANNLIVFAWLWLKSAKLFAIGSASAKKTINTYVINHAYN